MATPEYRYRINAGDSRLTQAQNRAWRQETDFMTAKLFLLQAGVLFAGALYLFFVEVEKRTDEPQAEYEKRRSIRKWMALIPALAGCYALWGAYTNYSDGIRVMNPWTRVNG
jgi:hypothetical protein